MPDGQGITVSFQRSAVEDVTFVTFKIPDSAQVLSRSPEEFMRWFYEEMMKIAADARGAAHPSASLALSRGGSHA